MNLSEMKYDHDWLAENMKTDLYIMKRSGERVPFDRRKIEQAIFKANQEVTTPSDRLNAFEIELISWHITEDAMNAGRDYTVEEIQDKVENSLMATGKHELARRYITYRYLHNLERKLNPLDKKIEGIINVKVQNDGSVHGTNEEVNQENSNKDPKVISVQRDYIAGEWCREYTDKHMLPPDVTTAHKHGLIHVHDTDYMPVHEHNCCLINLEDMLQNGTCISGTYIDTPKSFATAATVTSQIIAQVASQQYGLRTAVL